MNKWISLAMLCLGASAVGGAAGSLLVWRRAGFAERPHPAVREDRAMRSDDSDRAARRDREGDEHRRGEPRDAGPHGWRSDFRTQALDVAARRIARRFNLDDAQQDEIHGLLDRATNQERALLDEYRQALHSDDRDALEQWDRRRMDIRESLEEALIPLVGAEGVRVLRREQERLRSMRGWGHQGEGWDRPGERDHRRSDRPGSRRPR